MNVQQKQRIAAGSGFIAALDQSGGSTPRALKVYGVNEDAYSGAAEMFDRIHEMRTRIVTSPAFTGDRIIGAILFEQTIDRQIEGRDSADYLWSVKQVVPFLKVDNGLDEEGDGIQLMKPIPQLDHRLAKARDRGVFGTKMRSVVKQAHPDRVAAITEQQFEIGRRILEAGLTPILEPEVDINSPAKSEAEGQLLESLLKRLDTIDEGQQVMFKLSLPDRDGHYQPLVEHPKVLKVAALSGGYSRHEANARLARNHGMIASFSRALAEGLSADQRQSEFDARLEASVESIYQASIT